jgi:predicted permease
MLREFHFAARGLARWRGGAVSAVLTLAIGIGATTGLYALVQTILPDLPGVPDLERLGRVYASSQSLGVTRSPVALHEFDASLSKAASFSAVGAYAQADALLGTGAAVRPIVAGYASPGFFGAMGVAPAAGRVFTASDTGAARPAAILSHALWRRQFPDGRLDHATIAVNGVERAVVGVMPPHFSYGFVGIGADLWLPLGRPSHDAPAIVTVFGRLRGGATWAAAASELRALSRGQWTWHAIPVQSDTRTRALSAYAFTLGPALLVLLIACVNVACLLMARGIERDKELSVRRALGATRLGIVRLLLTESLALALVSGAIGGGLAVAILRALAKTFAAFEPDLAGRLAVGFGLLPIALGASALACLIFGTVPALRLSKRDVAASLNGVPPRHRVQIAGYGARDLIVFTEVAAAVGLIVWTAMLYTLFAQIDAIRFNFAADRVVAMRVPARDVERVAARVSAVPGVTHVSISSGMLGGGARVRVEQGGAQLAISRVPVGDGFLETLGVPLLRGRWFDRSEHGGGAGVAVVSENAARQLAPGADPIGMRLRVSGREVVIIGVCGDPIDYGALQNADAFAPAEMYVPYEPPAMSPEAVVLARLSADPHGSLRAIAAAAQVPDGARPARPVVLSDEAAFRGRDSGGRMVLMRILASFAGLTLLLAASGVFAVIGQSVTQRTREFGIRLAIGATPRRVLSMVLAREAKLIGVGIGVGLVFTMLATRAMFAELARLSAVLPSMWVGALLLSAGVAALAVASATWRIVRLDPAAVLRR